jgi:integrase
MQNGSVIRAERQRGPDVWEFRWREPSADGKRKHRRMILGSIEQLADETAAREAIATIRLDLNHGDAWLKTRSTTVLELAAHYRERELEPDTIWKTHSTEASQKPVPLDPRLAEALHTWRRYTRYRAADDWVFASPAVRGQKPYWGQCLMRTIIRPAATKVGITQHIGWHTFRHTYSSLLRANRTDIKVTQELLRHASSRVTLDTYTQAVTVQKRRAQSSVIRLLQASTTAAG